MEAYTELLRVTGNEEVKERLMWIMDTVADKVYNPVLKRQEVFFDREYHSIIDLYSYGHDIETAWLLDRGVSVLGSSEYRDKMHAITKVLTRQIYDIAFDGHSLSNECDKGKVDTNRVWWVQAETVVGFVNGWQQDPEHEEYLEGALLVWKFIKEHVIDKRAGSEWFWLVTQEELLNRKNVKSDFYNGVYDRYEYPVLTREHIPLTWRYDLNKETNPYFMERLGINAVMNSGAIELNGKYYLVARIEGNDRKSFFGVAESDNGVDGFRSWDYPILLDDTCPEETNVYDMRLTKHEDGYIYGVFCSESKDTTVNDLSAAVAAAGIVRTKDLKHWERLDNLVTLNSPQQRNVVLHPEFVNGKYAFYTRPMDDFIETGSGGGIGFGLCDDITHAVIDEEKMTSLCKYHTITEAKNGAGATPIKTDKGWIHIAHGVRNTAAGLRYVIYAFATALDDPSKVIAEPFGLLIGPRGEERIVECVAQRCGLIEKNLELLK